MRTLKPLALTAAILAAFVLTGCSGDDDSSASKDAGSRQKTYDKLVQEEPAHSMDYSPSRVSINKWIDTWSKPNALAFVYLVNSEGKPIGYYIMKGPPISACASLTRPQDWVDSNNDGDSAPDHMEPAPGVDGVYYSGGQCNTYYGTDATSGAYLEYTAGLGINVLLYDQPLPAFNGATALGPTAVSDVN